MPRMFACLLGLLLVPSPMSAQVTGGFVFGSGQGGPNQPPPRDSRPATGRSTIRGRVVAADSSQPMRRAIVRVTAPELRVPRTTLTDVNGRYEFQQLPAGRYSINAMKNAFVNWSYGQTQPASPGKPLVLAENQTVEGINISLPRGSVVTGRVTDEFGDPAPNVMVSLMRLQFQQGQQRLMPAGIGGGSPATNDIGEYRMFGLSPGQYYIAAQPQGQAFSQIGPPGSVAEGQEARNGYARTFYPGTADVSTARKITLGTGETLSEINIVLLPTRLATISGVAVDAQGQPLNGGSVQVMPRGGVIFGGGGGGPLRPDGTFTIANIPPGQYTLRANAPRNPPGPATPPVPPDFSGALVTVNGEDVTDVRLTPVLQVTVSGRVSFDDAGAAQSLKPSSIRVMAQPLNADDSGIGIGFPAGGGPVLPLQDDFSFELKTAPGRIALRALFVQQAPGAPPPATGTANGWQLKAVRVNGTDVTDSGIEIDSPGARGIEIELTNRRQQVSGSVADGNGARVKDYIVVIFAQDRARWTAPFNRYLARAQAGDDGLFKVGSLPPGDYYAIALDGADVSQWQDPEFLEGLVRQASSVSLAPGDTRTVDLKLFTVR